MVYTIIKIPSISKSVQTSDLHRILIINYNKLI